MLISHFLCVSGSTLKGIMPITVSFQNNKVIANEKLPNLFSLKLLSANHFMHTVHQGDWEESFSPKSASHSKTQFESILFFTYLFFLIP